MINSKLVEMLSVINRQSILVLEMVVNATWETADFDDLDSLDALYRRGWIDGISDGDDCMWILTPGGRKLYSILEDLIV